MDPFTAMPAFRAKKRNKSIKANDKHTKNGVDTAHAPPLFDSDQTQQLKPAVHPGLIHIHGVPSGPQTASVVQIEPGKQHKIKNNNKNKRKATNYEVPRIFKPFVTPIFRLQYLIADEHAEPFIDAGGG